MLSCFQIPSNHEQKFARWNNNFSVRRSANLYIKLVVAFSFHRRIPKIKYYLSSVNSARKHALEKKAATRFIFHIAPPSDSRAVPKHSQRHSVNKEPVISNRSKLHLKLFRGIIPIEITFRRCDVINMHSLQLRSEEERGHSNSPASL